MTDPLAKPVFALVLAEFGVKLGTGTVVEYAAAACELKDSSFGTSATQL
jgi:hypothetical protein